MIKQVKQYPISEVFSNEQNIIYRIPKYQREYTWGIRNWDSLFDDVTDNDEGYFLGSFICVGVSSMGIPELEIIDGQQRFISIALLLTALYSKLLPYKKDGRLDDDEITDVNNLRNAITNRIKEESGGKGKKKTNKYSSKLILQDQNYNNVDFESILKDNEIIDSAGYQNYRGVRRIEKAFKHFCKCIDQYVEERQEDDPDAIETDILFELTTKFKSIILVGIEVDSHKDAYMLFESLNHRGVPLSAIDLIKNILIAEADSKGDVDKCYDKWTQGLEYIGDDYAVQERFFRQYYNAFRDELNAPFVTSNSSKKYPLAYKATRTTILDIYEKIIKNDYDTFVCDFLKEAEFYSNIVNNVLVEHVYDDEFIDLERIQGAPSYLLLLYLLSEQERLKIEDEDIESVAQDLVKFFVRRNVTDVPATRNLDRIFMDIVADIKSMDSAMIKSHVHNKLKEASAPDTLFEERLRGPIYIENDKVARFILCSIEAKKQTKETYTDLWKRDKSNNYIWTIEHIFPEGENIPECWVDMVASGDKKLANDYREKYVHTLGNLTLTGYNQHLSNKSFAEKKTRKGRDGKKMGYENGLYLNEEVVSETEWTIKKIKNRTGKLVDDIKDIFKWD